MTIVVIGLGLAVMYLALKAEPRKPFWVVVGALAVAIPITMLALGAGLPISLDFLSSNWLLALAVGALIGALVTRWSVWLMASIVLAGAYAWLGLGAIFMTFVFAVLSAAFVAIENKKRKKLWLYLAVAAATVATLFAANTASSTHSQAPTPQAVASANR